MPSNQWGPYFPRANSGGIVDSPNKKFQADDDRAAPPEYKSTCMPTIIPGVIEMASPSQEPLTGTGVTGLVTIIMATLFRKHTIKDAVDSIIGQSYPNWELIIVDQGGSGYKFEDKRIHCYVHQEVLSAAYARNRGIAYASGQFICFFDDDDIMLSDYLAVMLEPFGNPAIQMTHCGVELKDGSVNWSYGTPSAMVRRNLVTPNWSSTSFAHDQLFFTAITEKIANWAVVKTNRILVKARTSPHGGMRGGGNL